jgi:hypothetical protein
MGPEHPRLCDNGNRYHGGMFAAPIVAYRIDTIRHGPPWQHSIIVRAAPESISRLTPNYM